jgi:hypothetical protein
MTHFTRCETCGQDARLCDCLVPKVKLIAPSKLKLNDRIEVAPNVFATVRRIEEIDPYAYHDAPNWIAVETDEFDVPFHFEEWGTSVRVIR